MNYIVHKFFISATEDPDLWAGFTLCKWENSEAGKWVMNNAIEKPTWHRSLSMDTYGYEYQIKAKLAPEQITYWKLKYE